MGLKKILITGGAGYIGTPVVKELLKKNLKIVILDRFSFDDKSLNSFSNNKNIQIVKCDIRDEKIKVHEINVFKKLEILNSLKTSKVVFLTIGTTMSKVKGNREKYRRIDFGITKILQTVAKS